VFLNQPDGATVATLKNQYGFTETHFVYLFVGTFKATAGVEDLLRAFDRVYKADPRCRLLLIGNGLMHRQAQTLAGTLKSRSGIVFQEPVPYHRLPDYYALAQVIVCPDSDNAFSHYVVHIKYLDALASGRLVINGAFRSVQELNPEQPLSLLFQPSDTESLYQVMEDAKEQYEQRSQQFGFASTYVRSHLTYTASVPALLAFHQRVSRHPARHASLKSIRS
jgi:glycosyltransferase involved in cell wall biosynthesis